jgi:SAM-dependent methyltransferase
MSGIDLTSCFDYEKLIEEEKQHYSGIEVTEDLREGGVHGSTSWTYYWQHVAQTISSGPFGNVPEWLAGTYGGRGETIEILSLGSGYCGNELDFARGVDAPCRVHCTDINEDLFFQAQEVAAQEGLEISFRVEDLNFIKIEPNRYHMIFAHAVLHHVINLERLYAQIVRGLKPDGIFHLVEVVGQNRKLIWDENEAFANQLLGYLPRRVVGDHRIQILPEEEGMEGIRQEEIIPLMEACFAPVYEHRHGAFMRFLCTHPTFLKLIHPSEPVAKRCLDFMIECDDAAVRSRILRPLEIWGIYRPRG